MKIVLRFIFKHLFKLRPVNLNTLEFTGPTVIIPNHLSFLDAVILYLFLPPEVVFVVNTQIAQRFAFALKFRKHIAIDPLNPYSFKKIVSLVKTGTPVVLFPEGRITTTGGLMKVYDGAGFVALKTGATLYPLIFTGLEFSKFSRIKDKVRTRWFPAVQLYVDSPVRLEADRSKNLKLQKREFGARILETMQNALYRAKHRDRVNLFNQLLKAAEIHGPGKTVIEDLSQTVTYRKLITSCYILAHKFIRLFKDENNIGILLPNSIGHVITLFALFRNGQTPAILNFSAGVQNNLDCAETANLKTILTSRLFIEKAGLTGLAGQLAARYRIIYLEDIKATVSITDKIRGLFKYLLKTPALKAPAYRLILFTSGSESKPKGVLLSHTNIMANINQVSCVIDYTHRDKILNALPMFHSFGLTAGTLLPLLSGMEVYLYPSPLHYKIIPEVTYDRNATIIFGTSTFLAGYGKFAHPYDFYSIRYVFAGAEKLKEETRALWQDKFGIRILEGYGTTETAPVLSLNTNLANKKGTVGKFLPGIRWQLEKVDGVEDGGNLLVQGPNVMEGYLLHGQGFVPVDEWYNCGDIVSIDDEGFITIRARLKRFAKISGEMVSLNLVEELAGNCFGASHSAAVNVPDMRKGELVVLFTTEKTATRQALREYLSHNHQSPLLMPGEIHILDKIPLLGSGKTDYVALKEMAMKGREHDVHSIS